MNGCAQRWRRRVRRWTTLAGLLLLAAVGLAFVCDRVVAAAGRGRTHTEIAAVPSRKVGLLLGTSPRLRHGEANPYYVNRIAAAVALFRAGKIQTLLVSGDNSRAGYDEPTTMKEDLVAAGIPPERVVLDFAGFRTLDSVVRAREVFGVTDALVISQEFHVERAIFLGSYHGVRLHGFAAADPSITHQFKVRVREVIARTIAIGDIICARRPKFLGPKIAIDG